MFEKNHELYIVTSSSMVPTLNPGDAVVISHDDIDHSAFAQLRRVTLYSLKYHRVQVNLKMVKEPLSTE